MLELIKGLIRPFLVVSFAIVFLWFIIEVVPPFFTSGMADLAFKTFIDAILLITGLWIGGRTNKK
jgi:ABC-type thiamin/hydroxymethylpyrimidine transport system permease subunit